MKKSSWEKEIGNWLKLKGKGKNHPFLVMANFVGIWETTGIIKRMISLVIWDPKKLGMPRPRYDKVLKYKSHNNLDPLQ